MKEENHRFFLQQNGLEMLVQLEKMDLDEEKAKRSQEFEKMKEQLALESDRVQKELSSIFKSSIIFFY